MQTEILIYGCDIEEQFERFNYWSGGKIWVCFFYNALLGFRFVTLVKGLSTQHDKSHAIRILVYGFE